MFQVSNLLAQNDTAEKMALRIAQAVKTSTASFPEFAEFDVSKHLKGTKINYIWKRNSLMIEVFDTIPSNHSFILDINGKYIYNESLYDIKKAELRRIINELILKEKFGESAKLTYGKGRNSFYHNIRFTGIIDSVDMSCGSCGGDCFLMINDHKIVWEKDWGDGFHKKIPRGNLLNSNGLRMEELKGRKVEVYCGYAESYSSIIGSKDYYIKLLD